MLSDKPRTQAYRTAIENGKTFIKDKVLLLVVCMCITLAQWPCSLLKYISGGGWSLMGSQGMPLLINYIVHDDTKNEMIFILQPILQSLHHIFNL